jgi:hypothetical protein
MDTASLIENNYFQLLNGSWVKGYPLAHGLQQAMPLNQASEQESERFYRHAFLFWNHRDRIFSDSRMFLAPVPVCNRVGYISDSAFQHPVLGVYLEWWEHCAQTHVMDKEGERLLWHIWGTPLSGRNECASVDKDGNSKITPVCPFAPVWHSFMDINARYREIKPRYEAYTLEQVIQKQVNIFF